MPLHAQHPFDTTAAAAPSSLKQQQQARSIAARSVPDRRQSGGAVSAAQLAELFAAQQLPGAASADDADGETVGRRRGLVPYDFWFWRQAAGERVFRRLSNTPIDTPVRRTSLFDQQSLLPPCPDQRQNQNKTTKTQDRAKLERLARALEIPPGQAKALAFKKRALLDIDGADLESRLGEIAATVGVTPQQARRMASIQPALLLETKRSADALALGLRAICYELDCPKDEAVALILDNPSILHGREMHLSVADIAHLAMLREPTGRIVD